MAIHAVCVCVDYGDYLAWALPHNRRHFDSFTVVTTGEDAETRRICERYGAAVVLTERLHHNGSAFDRGGRMHGVGECTGSTPGECTGSTPYS